MCSCYAWWEGHRCEKRMLHIPYKPLSERMLQEPFWLGLITVFVVLAVIGLVWCAKRHFPEKIEKLLAEEADRNRRKLKTKIKHKSNPKFMVFCRRLKQIHIKLGQFKFLIKCSAKLLLFSFFVFFFFLQIAYNRCLMTEEWETISP